jgi:AcrR family transcriptional regulator
VIEAAAGILDDQGPDGLTIPALAARFGVKAPSPYTHVAGIDDAREAVRLDVLEALGDELQRAAAGRAGADALTALARAYRAFALRHPGRYVLSLRG